MDLIISDELIDFLASRKLTFGQYAICCLLYEKEIPKILKYNNEVLTLGDARIPKEDGSLVREIDDLVDRGFILHTGVDKEYYSLDNFMLSDKFTKGVIADEEMAEELWSEYPPHGRLKGGETYNTKVMDYDEFVQKYLRVIRRNAKKHREVMKKLRAYKKKENLAEMNLSNFVGSRHWENLSENESEIKFRFH